MSYGLSPAFANQLLGSIAGTSFTPPAASWAELHIGDPGLTGSSNISSVSARQQITWNIPSGGVMTMSNTPSWGNWSGTSPETIVGLAIWTAVTAGTFVFSFLLSVPVTIQTGFPLTLGSEQITIGSLAA